VATQQHIAAIATERAVREWTRRNSGQWTEADEADLQGRLAAAPEHQAAYDKVGRAWDAIGPLASRLTRLETPPRRDRSVTETQWRKSHEAPTGRGGAAEEIPRSASGATRDRRRRMLPLAAAALLAVLVLPLGLAAYNWWNGRPTTWSVQRGQTRTLLLADGTRIVLDANSELEARIGARARHVVLRRGEALLTVAHDASRPFEVEVGPGRITDLGTRFDVENLQGHARISVLEGRVGVQTPRGKVLLEAGRAGGYDDNGTLLPVQDADRSVALWQDGQRHFDAERLPEVLERLERYHPVTFELADPKLRELRVSGTFRTGDLPLFLRTLQAALPVESHWIDSRHVQISPRK
jgi:transmembrane sensor